MPVMIVMVDSESEWLCCRPKNVSV